MSNESKFINIQVEACKEVEEKEEKKIDRVCPTCVPNPSYMPPQWWKQTEPWLNEKTCEYSVAVYVNQDGDSYRLSDLKQILEPAQVTLSESGIPTSPPTTGVVQPEIGEAPTQEIKNQEKFDRIKRSYVKTGIRALLRHYEKLEANEYICAKNDCSIITTQETKDLVRQIKHFASLNSDVTFSEWARQTGQSTQGFDNTIDNPNSLELFASATEHYFYGITDNAMAVLVTIPAYIFDQVPKAPELSTVDVDIQAVKFKVSEFTAWISKMEQVFVLFSKFQSYYKNTENARLYHLVDGEETPYYARFMEGRFDAFEKKLSKFIESKGYEYYNFFSRLISYPTDKRVEEIQLLFDKSDPEKPFKLAPIMRIKTPGCSEVELKLPDEPDPILPTGDNIRHTAFFDQTLMGYIANYHKIKTQIEARENPPWLDFLVENTFPTLAVNYGNTLNSKSSALGCLLDKFEGLDDYILNQSMSFFDSVAYKINKNNCRLLRDADKGKITVFDGDEKKLKQLEKSQKEQQKRQLKEKGIIEDKNIKSAKNETNVDNNVLQELMNSLNPCNWKKITLKAVQCLMSGMTIEEGYRQILKATVGSLTTESMEVLLAGLPQDQQAKVRQTIEKEFKDLPAPWEVGYDSGDIEAAYDRIALQNINQQRAPYLSADEIYEELESKKEILADRKAKGPKPFYQETIKESQEAIKSYNQGVQRLEERVRSKKTRIEPLQDQIDRLDLELSETSFTDPKRDQFKRVIRGLTTQLEELKDEIKTAEDELKELTKFQNRPPESVSEEDYNKQFDQKTKDIEAEIKALEGQYIEAQNRVREKLKKDPDDPLIKFDTLSQEEQQEIINKEKQKLTFVGGNQADRIRQGTYGRAVGNVQKELLKAYGDAILEHGGVQEIIQGINKLPGAKIIGEYFLSFDCPNYSFFYPPLDEFLGTFTVGACGKGKTRPFLLPDLAQLPTGWSYWDAIKDAFVFSFKKTISQVVSALILKTVQALEAGTCQALSFASEGTQDLITASLNGGRFPRSIYEIASDVVCGDELDEKTKNEDINKLFSLSGAPKRGNTTPSEILETMSTLGSEQDYLKAMTGNAEPGFLENVARTLQNLHPEYESLTDPNSLDQVLQNAGNFMTEEQRDRALAFANEPQQFFPLDPSICLTNEQAEEYYNNLRDMFANQLADDDLARQFVEEQREQARGDLADVADILARGPEGILKDAIDDLLADPDPDCATDRSLLKTPEELKRDMQKLSLSMFARLQRAFIDDTIEENMAERAIVWSGLGDTMGILLMVTADTVAYNYAKHFRVRNQLFFRFLSFCGFFDNEAPFPETIARQMYQVLIDQSPAIDDLNSERYSYNNSKILLDYENGFVEPDKRFASYLFVDEVTKIRRQGQLFQARNFNYQFQSKSPDSLKNFIVDISISPEEFKFLENYIPPDDQLFITNPNLPVEGPVNFRNLVFKNFLDKVVKRFGNIGIPIQNVSDIVTDTNNLMFSKFKRSLLEDENGNIGNGFLHGGGTEGTITVNDLTYVDPEPGSTQYTYDESEGILGRSLTNNSRVQFLNPLKHGGSYEYPNIYILPEADKGFVSFAKFMVPEVDGCEPRGSDFLQLKQLEDELPSRQDKIKRNEKLSESPECVVEVPFDKISSPSTLASLEQIVTATIRVYLAEFMINSFSIHGNLALNDKNYDELILEYIAKKMQQGLASELAIFAVTYEGYTYWLLFLEQCAQVYNRKVQLGELEADAEARRAMDTINNAQIAYTKPSRDRGALFPNDFIVNKSSPPSSIGEFLDIAKQSFDDVYAYPAVGGYLIAQNTRRWNETFKPNFFPTNVGDNVDDIIIMRGGMDYPLGSKEFGIPAGGFRYWTQNYMNFAAKVATIAENEESCFVLLKKLIREQLNKYSDKIAAELNPRPPIFDINKYFIGASRTFMGSQIRAGLYDVEVPIGGDSGLPEETINPSEFYGTVNHCALSTGRTPFQLMIDNGFTTSPNVDKIGGMYLEKYLRIIPKGGFPQVTEDGLNLQPYPTPEENEQQVQFTIPENLPSDVININEFTNLLKTLEIPEEVNVSDWFGDAKLPGTAGEIYDGSIGIKFGVRACYVTRKDLYDTLNLLERPDFPEIFEKCKKEKTFFLSKDVPLVIPLASYEKDILDVKLSSLKDADDDFNQDLKCYVDGLTQTDEFNLVFNRIFNVKKVGSTLACYSDMNFLASIGLGQNERREPDLGALNFLDLGVEDVPNEDDRAYTFNDCKAECRKMFVSTYKRNDFDPDNEEDNVDEMSIAMQKALAKTFSNIQLGDDVSWWIRRRIKTNKPTDKEGKECQNQFASLFNIKR